ncbi:hypothetical protein [Thermosulfurimonas sp. F29]|uniref:hypothetical protein n=1 Tax=Thermosulfurimonas sp. F29 TaxID=2867247 RepID=UPI001C82A05C|nr:hypothetical protein [Thermosulfurimonas sp. F29]MBX6424240.1 hypothetical protein [Thermosulfurimonas sp. F29]
MARVMEKAYMSQKTLLSFELDDRFGAQVRMCSLVRGKDGSVRRGDDTVRFNMKSDELRVLTNALDAYVRGGKEEFDAYAQFVMREHFDKKPPKTPFVALIHQRQDGRQSVLRVMPNEKEYGVMFRLSLYEEVNGKRQEVQAHAFFVPNAQIEGLLDVLDRIREAQLVREMEPWKGEEEAPETSEEVSEEIAHEAEESREEAVHEEPVMEPEDALGFEEEDAPVGGEESEEEQAVEQRRTQTASPRRSAGTGGRRSYGERRRVAPAR